MTLGPAQPHTSHTVWNKLLSLSAPSLFLPPGAPQLMNLMSRPGLNSRVQSSSPEGPVCPKGKIFFSFESHSNGTRMWLWNQATWFYVLVPLLPRVYPLASYLTSRTSIFSSIKWDNASASSVEFLY